MVIDSLCVTWLKDRISVACIEIKKLTIEETIVKKVMNNADFFCQRSKSGAVNVACPVTVDEHSKQIESGRG